MTPPGVVLGRDEARSRDSSSFFLAVLRADAGQDLGGGVAEGQGFGTWGAPGSAASSDHRARRPGEFEEGRADERGVLKRERAGRARAPAAGDGVAWTVSFAAANFRGGSVTALRWAPREVQEVDEGLGSPGRGRLRGARGPWRGLFGDVEESAGLRDPVDVEPLARAGVGPRGEVVTRGGLQAV